MAEPICMRCNTATFRDEPDGGYAQVQRFDAFSHYETLKAYFQEFGPFTYTREEYFAKGQFGDVSDVWDDYVIMEGERIVARAAIWRYRDDRWEVAAVATVPDRQNKGYASALVRACTRCILAAGRIASCTTGRENAAMRHVAMKYGFTECAEKNTEHP